MLNDRQKQIKFMPFSKKFIYIGAGVVLLAVILYFIFSKKKDAQPNSAATTMDKITTTSATITPSAAIAPKKPSSPVNPPLSATQRYLDAIRVYKSVGYYFQFVDCHGSPGALTLKKGKKFMLDNRDNATHKIAVQGGQSFQVGAYNFAIATAPSTLGTHYITCDGGGAASIVVQQ